MGELEVIDQSGMAMVRAPAAVLAEAKRAAVALQSVIVGKKNPVIFNKEQYIEFEDWQLVGRFYGLAAKVVSTTQVEMGGARGFEARAVVVDIRNGIEVSAAESMCLNDEEKWSTRTKYEWVNGKREAVGTVPVPLFQLRSMAQTRASAKALRNVLAWVVVLAGYKPTVAEEMTGDEPSASTTRKPDVAMPQPKTNGVTASAADAPGDAQEPVTDEPTGILPANAISDAQRKRFYAKWKAAGKTEDAVKHYLKMKIGSEDDHHITKDVYEDCCAWADKK